MKSGMVAAETVAESLSNNQAQLDLQDFATNYQKSWAYKELHTQRNFGPAQHKLATTGLCLCLY